MSIPFSTPSARLLRALVEQLRHIPMPWPAMPEAVQQEHIDRMAEEVRTALVEAVNGIAGGPFTHFKVGIDSMQVKDGCKLSVTFPSDDPAVQEIVQHVGHGAVLVLVPDAATYVEGLQSVKADPDQHQLLPAQDDDGADPTGAGEEGEV